MSGVLVVLGFGIALVIGLFSFIAGWKNGRARLEAEIAEDAERRAADKALYDSEKAKIKREVFKDADTKKKKMSNSSGRDKFNAVNDVLRNEYVYENYDVVFPQFPDPLPVEFNEEDGTVKMPLWYWEKIAEYKIEIDAIEKYFSEAEKLKKK